MLPSDEAESALQTLDDDKPTKRQKDPSQCLSCSIENMLKEY